MAGQPRMRILTQMVEAQGGEEWVLEQLMARSLKDVAKDLECSPQLLLRWLTRDKARKEAWDRSRELSAHLLVEEASTIADGPADPYLDTREAVQRARLRIGFRQWLAGKRNRTAYGAPPDAPLGGSINIGQLFLNAARDRATDRAALPPPTEEADYEVLPAAEEPSVEDMLS